jgi:hypothetical protein
MAGPASVYAGRHAAWRADLVRAERRLRLGEWGRTAAALAVVAVIVLAAERRLDRGWVLVALGSFGAAGAVLVAADRRRERARSTASWYEAGLERLQGTWWSGRSGLQHAADDHPYAHDLDIVGERSLLARLDTTCTHPGSARLAEWLLASAAPVEVVRRQEAVRELRDDLGFREELFLAAGTSGVELDGGALAAWAEGPSLLPGRWVGPVLAALAAAVITTTAGGAAGLCGAVPGLAAAASALGVGLLLHRRVSAAVAGASATSGSLGALAAVMERIEARRFRAPFLRDAGSALREPAPASRTLRALARGVGRFALARNELVAPFAYAIGWPALQALAIERWRARYGVRVRAWLTALADVDAAQALATHAFENPSDPFPELGLGPTFTFDAGGLGHPLVPAAACVANDVRLGGSRPALLVVSGSNMSGKSTLLRAVGLNAVLALAGAPVRATRLRLSPAAVTASIRSRDSVVDGVSRFQAEVTRLGRMLECARAGAPVLFLVDEILHGTNSADRLVGAAAVLGELVSAGGIGLCTTHDLALARVVDGMGSRAANVHFADALRDGRLAFDYRLRAGPVTGSNTLALLRAAGLPV